MSLILGTRIHSSSGISIPELSQLENWCCKALEYADYVVIATDYQLFNQISQIVSVFGDRVHSLLVNPWKGFAHPLNAIVVEATFLGGNQLLLQSLEVQISPIDVGTLRSHLTSDTLVVGARMIESHGGDAGIKPINGMTSPWNTLALWNLPKLHVTGFLGISSGLIKDIPGGIEEVTTISLLQQFYPNQAHAKLVNLSQLKWITLWKDTERKKYHEQKMSSKLVRAEIQMNYFKVQRGFVRVL
ncbi:MAG: hypothetical protein F6K47_32075 [Symploca sp. SIO2E6]|nr:hypothetical protein [Symploca sp. SIO2E6]